MSRRQGALWTVLVISAASCALPELTIDEDLEDDDDGGRGGTAGAGGSDAGSSGQGGTGKGGGNQGGNAGTPAGGNAGQGGSAGKGGSSGQGGSSAQGGDSGQGGSSGKGGSTTGGMAGQGPCMDTPDCPDDLLCCGGTCVDPESDSAHCGECGTACPAGQTCSAGGCVCPAGMALCSGVCLDTANDPANCGECGAACSGSQRCVGGSCTSLCDQGFVAAPNGFVTSGNANTCWHGYSFVAIGPETTASPADFSNCGNPCSLCVTGRIGATMDYSGFVMVGMNLLQPMSGGNEGTVAPRGDGIEVRFTRNFTGTLRLQLSGPNGDTNPNDRWCAELAGTTSNRIPYSQFLTECWPGGMGTPYNRQPLRNAMLIVPGQGTAAVAFDYCLVSLVEY